MQWRIFFLLGLLTCSLSSQALSKETLVGPVKADVIRIIDGDTFEARAYIWIGHSLKTRVRIAHIDTPELRGKCMEEKQAAQLAKAHLEQLIKNQPVYLHDISNGKFAGRILADVRTQSGQDIAQAMVSSDYARPYDGKKRNPWCPF